MVDSAAAASPDAPGRSEPFTGSLRGLDAVNLPMGDVRDGVGPYLSVVLKGGEHWEPGFFAVLMRETGMSGYGATPDLARAGVA